LPSSADDWVMVGAALGGHLVHLVVFGVPVALLVAVIGWQEARARLSTRAPKRSEAVRVEGPSFPMMLAAAGLIVSAATHVSVIPEHLHEYLPYGVFFIALACGQLGCAVLLMGTPRRALVQQVAVASMAVVMLWFASRTTGLPISDAPWTPERVGIADVVATTAEALTVIGCLAALALPRLRLGASVHRVEGILR
jgi:hypothetical protein